MSRHFVVLCGTPDADCVGGKYMTDQQLPRKAHASRDEAFRCYTRWLKKEGFERLGPREYRNPENGYVRIITKRTRFGTLLRAGKEGRYMPDTPLLRGVII